MHVQMHLSFHVRLELAYSALDQDEATTTETAVCFGIDHLSRKLASVYKYRYFILFNQHIGKPNIP